MATLVDDPAAVTRSQMDAWARSFDSWDLCDQCCNNLFRKTPFAHDKALQWARRRGAFVRRAGFALMACLAVHDKTSPDERFERFLTEIGEAADDDRNFVKKAVNWALRQIGKRNASLHRKAIEAATLITGRGGKSARWIASDALRELRSPKVLDRFGS
jgi:3-methyladenine DNA glycosylase AlkD